MSERSLPDIRAYLEIRTAGPAGFSPDGETLLISSNLSGTSQLYRHEVGTSGSLRQLTELPEPVSGGYLPDRRALLLATDTGGNERHQLYLSGDAPEGTLTSVEDLHPLVVDADHIHRPGGVTRDGRFLAYATNRRTGDDFDVWIRSLEQGTEELVVDEGGWNSASGFSPDGRYLAVSTLTERPGDNRLRLLDRSTGELIEIAPHDEVAAVGAPSWLPDGQSFFFATDVGRDTTAIARGAPDGSWHHVLEGPWSMACGIDWQGRHLLVVRNADGRTEAELRDPETLEVTLEVPLRDLPGHGVAGGWRFSRDGRRLAFAYSSSLVPGDAWILDTGTGELERATTSPSAVDPSSLVEAETVRVPSFDGLEVPAFVYRPAAGGPGRRPVVLVIHGGPESQFRPSFSPLIQYLVARGFAVVAPNVRGSTGYGKRYQHLDDVALRLDSVRDLAAVHDWIAGSDDLDPQRCALYGGSYGGYMVLAGLTMQPERWAAGVDVVGIADLVTFLQNTAPWRRRFREREYGSLEHDREVLVEASPMTHVDRLRAPLFIIHGANDPRVPLSEAEQIAEVLARKGVRHELLVYGDEGHGLAKLRNRLDAYPKVADFLEEVLT